MTSAVSPAGMRVLRSVLRTSVSTIWTLRLVAEAEGQLGGERAVELAGDEAFGAAGEDLGEGAVAGADLDDGALADVAECVYDGVAGCVVDEKILSELWLDVGA